MLTRPRKREFYRKSISFCDKNGQVMVPFGDKDTWLSFGGNMYTDRIEKQLVLRKALSVNFPTFYLVKQISKKTLEKQLPAIESGIAVFAQADYSFCCLWHMALCRLYLWILTPMAYSKKSIEVIQQGNLNYRIRGTE
ncbi:MAG: hypothetical protein ACLTML_09590 [Blautia faecis]